MHLFSNPFLLSERQQSLWTSFRIVSYKAATSPLISSFAFGDLTARIYLGEKTGGGFFTAAVVNVYLHFLSDLSQLFSKRKKKERRNKATNKIQTLEFLKRDGKGLRICPL